jgi:hypothetical protein
MAMNIIFLLVKGAKLKGIKDALPYGYHIETGGSIEESVKANGARGPWCSRRWPRSSA